MTKSVGEPRGATCCANVSADRPDVDYRFTLANERTYLAWLRTALALLAGGAAAAKGLRFDHDLLRWMVAAPPMAAGAVLSVAALKRWRATEGAMHQGTPIAIGKGFNLLAFMVAAYAVVVLAASILDG